MPKIYEPIEAVAGTVLRPIVYDVARTIMEWTGIPNIRIIFPDGAEEAYQPGSSIDNLGPDKINLTSQGMVSIRVREKYTEEKMLTAAVLQMDNEALFRDSSVGFYLVPSYAETDLEMEIEYRATDKETAARWRDEVHQRVATNRAGLVHTVSYNYIVPIEYNNLIRHIHALRENQAGYGQTFDEYIDQCFVKEVSETVTIAGTEPRWTVAQNQTRVLGHFDFTSPEPAQKAGEASSMTTSFTYKIKYATPVGVMADYPLLVHNQLVDDKWIVITEPDPAVSNDVHQAKSTNAIRYFEIYRRTPRTVESGMRFPPYHEFMPKSVASSTLQVASILIGVNPFDGTDSNRNFMNISELDEDISFSEQFLKFLKKEHCYLNTYGLSFAHVSVYNGRMPIHSSRYSIDKDLNIWLNEEPNLRDTYYIRIALVTDPFVLTDRTRNRMRDHGSDLIMISETICPNLKEYGMLPKIQHGDYITRADADTLYTRLRQCTKTSFGGLGTDQVPVQWNLANGLYIVAHRHDDLKDGIPKC